MAFCLFGADESRKQKESPDMGLPIPDPGHSFIRTTVVSLYLL